MNTKAIHDKYGDVVRVAPDTLSFTTSQAWQGKNFPGFIVGRSSKEQYSRISELMKIDIYGYKPNKPQVPKAPRFGEAMGANGTNLIGINPYFFELQNSARNA